MTISIIQSTKFTKSDIDKPAGAARRRPYQAFHPPERLGRTIKIVTVVAEQVSHEALNAALPVDGIHNVTINETQSFSRTPASVTSYRGHKVAKHVTTNYRIEIVADDDAVQRVVDGIAFARAAGLLGDARAWITAEATDLFAASTSTVADWRDVTARFQSGQHIAASEQPDRLFITHVRDGRIVWASPSVSGVLGATPDYWIGREVWEIVPPAELTAAAADMSILVAGGIIEHRVRVVAVDGEVHWVHLRANPFYDADGRQDGLVASLRLIDV